MCIPNIHGDKAMGKVIDAKERFTSSKQKNDNQENYEKLCKINSTQIALKMMQELNSYFIPRGEEDER